MSKYFNLTFKTNQIIGKNQIVLYDFEMNTSYHLKKMESMVIKDIIQGKQILDIKEKYGEEKVEEFLSILIRKGLGDYSDTFIPRETFRKGVLKTLLTDENLRLQKFFVELPLSCEKSCSHCNSPKINSCFTCKVSSDEINKKDSKFYYSVLREVISIGCSNIYFHGGDPLSDWDFTENILEFSSILKTESQNLFVITNGELLDEKKASFFVKYKIIPIIVMDLTSLSKESINNNLEKLSKLFGVEAKNIMFNLVIERKKLSEFTDLQNFFLNKEFNKITTSIIVEKEESINYSKDLPLFSSDIDTFRYLESYHPCLSGTLALNADKKIYPCPSMSTEVILDLSKDKNFFKVFEQNKEKVLKYWKLSLERVQPCNQCEFRRLCMDCRAVETLYSKDIYEKGLCSYQKEGILL